MLKPDFKIEKKQNFNLIGKIKVKVLVVSALVVVSLFGGQLVFANKLATDGEKLADIEAGIEELEAQNTTLKVKIASESSLVNMTKKAQDLGFATPTQVIAP